MRLSLIDVKKLFARSGNRCAFPKCVHQIIEHESVIGEICHIRAASPEGPRYDPDQSQTDRDSYENLILLCGVHHKVVDDDVEAYTAERLMRMKLEHEKNHFSMPAGNAPEAAIISLAQSGGITAQTVVAQTINLHSNAPHAQHQIDANRALWEAMVAIKKEFNVITMVDLVYQPEEVQAFFASGEFSSQLSFLFSFKGWEALAKKLQKANANDVDKYRLFVKPTLFDLFFTYRAMFGRLAVLIDQSFEKKKYVDWRFDSGFQEILASSFTPDEIAEINAAKPSPIDLAANRIERRFLDLAGLR